MIPPIQKVELIPEGKVLFNTLLTETVGNHTIPLFKAFVSSSSEVIDADDIVNHLAEMYRYLELFDDTHIIEQYYEINTVFLQGLKDVFTAHKDYYEEILVNYQREFDYRTGITRSVTRNKTGTKVSERDISRSDTNRDTSYELPNKVIDPTNITGYASSINDSTGTNTASDDNTDTYNLSDVDTYTDPSQMLSLKRQYLRQVRDVYEEFAREFTNCFVHTY